MTDQNSTTPPEVFKPIPNFPGYEVSDHGRVRSYWKKFVTRSMDGRIIRTEAILADSPQRILRPSTTRDRLSVTLVKQGKRFCRLVYRLVLEAFVGPCPPGMECRHFDGIPTNCFLENLSWDTHSENMLDRTKHGTNWDCRGMNCPTAKLTDAQILNIRASTGSQKSIGRKHGVCQSNVSRIINRKRWKHL